MRSSPLTSLLIYIATLPILSFTTTGILHSILLYCHALGLAWQLFQWFQSSPSIQQKDMYNFRNVIFNLEIPPKTLWFNMGLWYDTNDNDKQQQQLQEKDMNYSAACERLVEAVLEEIEMKPGSRVLDVGYGCGDSCFLLADRYGCKVTGLTNEKNQWHISKKRLVETKNKDLQERIELIYGSATDDFEQKEDSFLFDHILSIDSAYHYLTRWKFLKNAMTYLVPQGTLGLYDLTIHPNLLDDDSCFHGDSNIKKYVIELLGHYLLNIPKENMVTAEQYRDQLVAMGYDQVIIKPVDGDRVFGGLSRFIQRQYQEAEAWDILPPFGNRIFMLSSISLFNLLARKQWIVPVIVSVRNKEKRWT
ncbi:S-adenosyl-L-methionine-dependent methyltransferase [Circinella umbellata]|nr:S-adenosyl-L-methionine-dependent methyltransferase [Circinella umbellata]